MFSKREFSVATTGDLHVCTTRGSLANSRELVKCPCPARENLAIYTIIVSLERGFNKLSPQNPTGKIKVHKF